MTHHTTSGILVGIDGSPNAAAAAAWARAIGNRMNEPVTAMTTWTQVSPATLGGIEDPTPEARERATAAATQSLHDAGLDDMEITTVRGPATEALLQAADEMDTSMLVVGTRGLGPLTSLLLGSISRRLLFTTRRPLVIVPYRSAQDPSAVTRVLVGVDCSPVAHHVLSWSASLCARLRVPATIVRCADPGCERPPGHVALVDHRVRFEAEEALGLFRDRGVHYDIVVAHCDPRSALLETAEDKQAGLIVIGSRGAGQFRGIGGTASYLARHSPIPLAVVP